MEYAEEKQEEPVIRGEMASERLPQNNPFTNEMAKRGRRRPRNNPFIPPPTEISTAEASSLIDAAPPKEKRGRGRPKGSKNKDKDKEALLIDLSSSDES